MTPWFTLVQFANFLQNGINLRVQITLHLHAWDCTIPNCPEYILSSLFNLQHFPGSNIFSCIEEWSISQQATTSLKLAKHHSGSNTFIRDSINRFVVCSCATIRVWVYAKPPSNTSCISKEHEVASWDWWSGSAGSNFFQPISQQPISIAIWMSNDQVLNVHKEQDGASNSAFESFLPFMITWCLYAECRTNSAGQAASLATSGCWLHVILTLFPSPQ